MIPAGGGRSPMSPGGSAAGRWAGGAETKRGGRVAGDRDAEEREGDRPPSRAHPPVGARASSGGSNRPCRRRSIL